MQSNIDVKLWFDDELVVEFAGQSGIIKYHCLSHENTSMCSSAVAPPRVHARARARALSRVHVRACAWLLFLCLHFWVYLGMD